MEKQVTMEKYTEKYKQTGSQKWICAPGYEEGKNFWRVSRTDDAKRYVVVRAKTIQQACWVAAEKIGLDWKKEEDRDKMYAVRTVQSGAW